MSPRDKQFGFKEAVKVAKLLGFEHVLTVGSHIQMKNKKTGMKATLPFYKTAYSQRLIGDIAWQLGITRNEFIKLATDKDIFKKKKRG